MGMFKKLSFKEKMINQKPVYMSNSLNQTLKLADDEKRLRLADTVDKCIQMLLDAKKSKRVNVAIEAIEMFLNKPEVKKQISEMTPCKKGCSACCYMHVDVLDSEAKRLVNKYKDFLLQKKDELIKQSEIPDDDKQTPRRCVFLKLNGECGIYQDRPLACRKYFVQSDPKYCDHDQYEADKHAIHSYESLECLETAFYQLEKAGPLPKMVLKYL